MIEVRAPKIGDIETISKDAAEGWVKGFVQSGFDAAPITANPWTRVAAVGGKPIAAGGFIDQGHDTAFGWALVGAVPDNEFVGICRAFRRQLLAAPFKWIEAHCLSAFHQSQRWVKCLGFEPVNGERCFTPDGREFRKFIFRKVAQ